MIAVSASPNRWVRLVDISWTLLRERRRIDILFVHVYGGPSFVVEDIASRIGRRPGGHMIMLLHGGAFPRFMTRFPRWIRRVLRRADAIVAPSAFLARVLQAQGYECRIIPNVIDIERYPFRLRRRVAPRLFWMRSFHEVYNPLMGIQVLERLRSSHPDATLVMGGQDKGLQAVAERYARSRNLEDAVRFPGFLDMEQKVREGSASDVFLNTSHVDNMPVALVEAGALGLPVVTTRVGGIGDLVSDGETALLTPDGDVESMAEAVRRLLSDQDLAARLSAGGRRLAERSGWNQVRPQWEALFAELKSRSGRRDARKAYVRT